MGKSTKRSNIILRSINVSNGLVECKIEVSAEIKKYFTSDTFFIEYDRDMSAVPLSVLACPFVSSLLAFAWITDSVIWVDELDRTFYKSLSRLREAYQDIFSNVSLRGRVVPSKFVDNQVEGNNSIILFSGGADCHASLIRNWHKSPILLNIQGWFKSKEDIDPVADADKADITKFASEFDLQFKYVRSNFARIINLNVFDKEYQSHIGDSLWHGFLHSMAFIAIAMPLAWLNNVNEIIIASSLTTGLNFLCASNSTTDTEFCFADKVIVNHDGFELHRQNKIRVITDFQKSLGKSYFMRVCSFNDKNCCECEKCFRTILGIVAENVNPSEFGFHHNGTLKQHWQEVLNRKIALMGFSSEASLHWPHIIKRMRENYSEMDAEKQEFVDWFTSYDFNTHKKKAVRKYYLQNFFSILRRKLKG